MLSRKCPFDILLQSRIKCLLFQCKPFINTPVQSNSKRNIDSTEKTSCWHNSCFRTLNRKSFLHVESEMEWPSRNIPPGGVLHPKINHYDQQIHSNIKILLDESKLSSKLRKKDQYNLRTGDPLGFLKNNNLSEVLVRPGSSKRRSRETIEKSGAYKRESFIPKRPIDREKEKRKLQDKMAYNKDLDPFANISIITPKNHEDEKKYANRFEQLVDEIKEREEWIKEMDTLGEGSKYRDIIQQQIQAKVREMRSLKESSK